MPRYVHSKDGQQRPVCLRVAVTSLVPLCRAQAVTRQCPSGGRAACGHMSRCSQRLRGQALGRGGSHCWGVAADESPRLTLTLWGGGRQDLANHKHEHDRRTRVSQRTAEANKTVECWGPGWRRSAGGQEGLPGGGGIYATTGRSGHWCWGSRVFFPQSIENTRTLESPAALCPWSGGPDGGRRLVTCWVMRPSLPLGSPGHLGPCVPWDLEASPLLRYHPGTAWEAMPTQVGG